MRRDFENKFNSATDRVLVKLRFGLAPLLAVGVLLAYLLFSLGELKPGLVAVRTNLFTGKSEVIPEQGLVVEMPFIHNVQELSTEPMKFIMAGDKNDGPLIAKQLTIRCSDGANVHFLEFPLIIALIPGMADVALEHGNGVHGWLQWLKPLSRSILRDEFGKENTLAMSDPTAYQGAADRAKTRLNELLRPHGVQVTNIGTPRPKFNENYEATIQERINQGNQIRVIASELEAADNSRGQKLASVDQKMNAAYQKKRAGYESQLASSIATKAETKQSADRLRIAKIAAGTAFLSGAQQKAKQLAGTLRAKLAALRAEIEAFRSQPRERVMQAIAERLAGITVDVQPYSDDPNPQRVIVDGLGGGTRRMRSN